MALLQTLTEDWSSGSITGDGKWTDQTVGQGSIVSSQLNITTTTTAAYYDVISSTTNFDFTGSYAFVHVVDAGNVNIASSEVMLIVAKDANNWLVMFRSGNTLAARYVLAGVNHNLRTDTTYDSTIHKWFRIHESGGTSYFDYSTDGITWTNYTSVANPFAITSTSAELNVGTYNTETLTTTVIFGNFNISPSIIFGYKTLLGVGQA